MIEVCANVDPRRAGKIPVKAVREVLAAVDSEVGLVSAGLGSRFTGMLNVIHLLLLAVIVIV